MALPARDLPAQDQQPLRAVPSDPQQFHNEVIINQASATSSWARFREKIIAKTRAALKKYSQDSQQDTVTIGNARYSLQGFVPALFAYIYSSLAASTDNSFLKLVANWNPHLSTSNEAQLDELRSFLSEKLEESGALEELERQIDDPNLNTAGDAFFQLAGAISSATSYQPSQETTGDEEYNQQALAILSSGLETIADKQKQLATNISPDVSALDSQIEQQVSKLRSELTANQDWDTLSTPEQQAITQQLDDFRQRAEKIQAELRQQIISWRKNIFDLEWEPLTPLLADYPGVALTDDLNRETNLLEWHLEELTPPKEDEPALGTVSSNEQDGLLPRLLSFTKLQEPELDASQDATNFLQRYLRSWDQLLEETKERREDLFKKTTEKIEAAANPSDTSETTDETDAGAAEEDQTTDRDASVATLIQLVDDWQSIIVDYSKLTIDQQKELQASSPLKLELLLNSRNRQELQDNLANEHTQNNISWDALFDYTQSLTSAIASFLADRPSRPEVQTTQESPIPGTDSQSLNANARQLNEIARAKHTLLTAATEALKSDVKDIYGLNEEMAEALVQQYSEGLSQDLWIRLIEMGGLEQELSGSLLISTWTGVVDDYLRQIAIRASQENNDPSSFFGKWEQAQKDKTREQRIEELSEKRALLTPQEADELVANFDADNIQAVLTSIEDFNVTALSPAQWNQLVLAHAVDFLESKGVQLVESDLLSIQGQATYLYDQLSALQTASSPKDIEKIYSAIFNTLGQTKDTPIYWSPAIFEVPELYAYIFSAQELRLVQQKIQSLRNQWAQVNYQQIANKRRQALFNFYQQVGGSAQSDQTTADDGFTYYQPEDVKMWDVQSALYFTLSSDLSAKQQDEILTIILIRYAGQDMLPQDHILELIKLMEAQAQQQELSVAQIALAEEYASLIDYQNSFSQEQILTQQAQQLNQAKQQNQNAKKMQSMAAAVKAAGYAATGQWHKAALEVLKDENLRNKAIMAATVAGSIPLIMLMALYQLLMKAWNFITAPVRWGWNQLKSGWGHVKDAYNSVSDAVTGGGGSEGGSLASGGGSAGFGGGELSESVQNAAQSAKESASSLTNTAQTQIVNPTLQSVSQVAPTISTAAATIGGAGSSIGLVISLAVIGPLITIMVLTIIVITVIGGSLNDLPMNYSFRDTGNKDYCFEGDDRIVQSAMAISGDLQQGFWDYWNYQPDFPQHWREDVFRAPPPLGKNAVYPCSGGTNCIQSYADAMFWCAWLVTYSYQANDIPVPVSASVGGHHGAWKNTTGQDIISLQEIKAEDLPLGGAVFVGSGGRKLAHISVLCDINVDSNGIGTITTCDSNNFQRQVNYDVENGYVVNEQFSGLTLDEIGPPPDDTGGSCAGTTAGDDDNSTEETDTPTNSGDQL